ncbi:MAG: YHS domain-containing protein [Planctomycetota bacterium]|jgi:YHS domain-containing protein
MEKIGIAAPGFLVFGALLFVLAGCAGGDGAEGEAEAVVHASHDHNPPASVAAAPLKAQVSCPVMGGEINRDFYADHNGKRVYFCCGGCDKEFAKNPEKYLRVLKDRGEKAEDVLH